VGNFGNFSVRSIEEHADRYAAYTIPGRHETLVVLNIDADDIRFVTNL
jgi:hypothetical protein